jgi:hypothetical protein
LHCKLTETIFFVTAMGVAGTNFLCFKYVHVEVNIIEAKFNPLKSMYVVRRLQKIKLKNIAIFSTSCFFPVIFLNTLQ